MNAGHAPLLHRSQAGRPRHGADGREGKMSVLCVPERVRLERGTEWH
jgi:hypothetical protein